MQPQDRKILFYNHRKKEIEMNISSERIIIRPWGIEDAEDLYQYAKNPKIGPSAGWPPHKSVEESKYIIQELLSCWGFFAIVLKETNKVIGCISILVGEASNFAIGPEEGELTFWLGEPYWGKGYTKEAILLLMDYAFYELELDGLWCGFFEENKNSRRLQEKCGFLFHHEEEVKTLWVETKKEIVMFMDYERYTDLYL